MRVTLLCSAACLFLGVKCLAGLQSNGKVAAPPAELKIPAFYTKHISASGYPIVASAQVNDYALKEAAYLVDLLLANRPDVRKAMIDSGSRLCIIGHNEYTTDLPDFAWLGKGKQIDGVSPKDWWDARARGTGGSESDPYCSTGEENLLGYPGDPYWQENILIHEFAHNIHLRGVVRVDPTFDRRLKETYRAAMDKGLWKGKYASVNHHEYFAEGVQSWFDNNRENDADHNHVNTRAELLEYDPGLAAMCKEVFGETIVRYTKPATRLTGHMTGYDPNSAPTFKWPMRLREAQLAIRRSVTERINKTNPSYRAQLINGWTVMVSNELQKSLPNETKRALQILGDQLELVLKLIPEVAVGKLKRVTFWLSPEYPGVRPTAEYHPGREWLVEHGRNPDMTRGIELTNVRIMDRDLKRMPVFVLHELAHAYHHQALGYDNKPLLEAFRAAKSSGKYDRVERKDADGKASMDKAYAITNVQEYFAECSEAYFGTNDFYPYNRKALEAHDPEIAKLLRELWEVEAEDGLRGNSSRG